MEYQLTRMDAAPVESYLALDNKIALEFHTYAEKTPEYPHDYGEMRRLRVELQKLCGITEVEALNVLIYRNVSDYIQMYNGANSSEVCTIGRKQVCIPEYIELLEYEETKEG